jgi:methyltransferase (TIGR00027 family)
LSQPWADALSGADFDVHQPTTWVVEGLLPYLSAQAQQDTLTAIAELSATGSRAVIERATTLPDTEDLEAKLRAFSAQTGLAMSDLLGRANPPDPAALLAARGWLVREHSVAQLCTRYKRRISLNDEEPSNPAVTGQSDHSRGGFVTARL